MLRNDKLISPASTEIDLRNNVINSKEQLLMDKLKKLDQAYKAVKDNRLNDYINSLPEALELERLSYDAPDDDTLKAKAETSYSAEYESGKTKLIEQIDMTRNALSNTKDKLSKAQQETLEKLDKAYETVKENIGNQALRRGLGRSSIVINKVTQADLSRAEQAGIIESDTRIAIENLDKEITVLEQKKQDSLKAFDLTYANKVQTELDKLIVEREKKIQSVLEYNNKLQKEEVKYQEDKTKKIEDYKDKLKKDDIADEEYYSKYGYTPGMKDEYESRYAMAYDFYMKLPPDTAKRILNENSDLEKYLGTKYYNKLKTLIVMRK